MRAIEKRGSRDRFAWICAARNALIQGGIIAVKLGRLARELHVSRESFYWHFKNLAELQDQLLRDWEQGNSAAYHSLIDPERRDGLREFHAMVQLWVEEGQFSPRWDSSVRDWARTSKKVARAVARVDKLRITIIRDMFLHMGYEEVEALVRARITYFHQIGYYTIAPRERPAERLKLVPIYERLLTGKSN